MRARRELLASVDGGRYVEPRKLTLAAYLRDEWLVATSPPAVAWKTWRERRDSFERHVIPRLGGVELQKLTPAQLTALYGDLLRAGGAGGQGLSPTTVRDLHRRLRKAFADAVRWGLMERNPGDLADPPSPKVAASARRAAMQTWDEDELRTFLEATSADPLGTLWLVAAMTGLRRSELMGLRWADLDLIASTLTVHQTVVEYAGGWAPTDRQKSAGSARTIHVDTDTVKALRSHRARQIEIRLAAPHWNDHDLVFPSEMGGVRSPGSVSVAFRRAVAKAGVPPIRLHDVRHTHATLLLRAGVNPKVVSERLGHSSVAFTLDTYAHVIPGMQSEAAELLATRIFRAHSGPTDEPTRPRH